MWGNEIKIGARIVSNMVVKPLATGTFIDTMKWLSGYDSDYNPNPNGFDGYLNSHKNTGTSYSDNIFGEDYFKQFDPYDAFANYMEAEISPRVITKSTGSSVASAVTNELFCSMLPAGNMYSYACTYGVTYLTSTAVVKAGSLVVDLNMVPSDYHFNDNYNPYGFDDYLSSHISTVTTTHINNDFSEDYLLYII
jgi:hypothetical protein